MQDLISRQAAIEALKEALRNNVVTFIKAKEAVSNIPSEDVRENARGKWIHKITHESLHDRTGIWCSNCGKDAMQDGDGYYVYNCETDFCPYCGADMRGGDA